MDSNEFYKMEKGYTTLAVQLIQLPKMNCPGLSHHSVAAHDRKEPKSSKHYITRLKIYRAFY